MDTMPANSNKLKNSIPITNILFCLLPGIQIILDEKIVENIKITLKE
jgi:hypothetical protein